MSIKVAVASTDGKVISQHFGRSDEFLIFEIDNHEFRYDETRSVASCCTGFGHNQSAFDAVSKVLSDCRGVIVSKIGDGASAYLENKGFIVFEAPMLIKDALNRIILENLLEGGV